MPLLIRTPFDAFKEVEKLLHYRFWDKGRERSNRAVALADLARGTTRRCPLRHDRIAQSGPPYDKVRAWICLRCNAAACEPEIRDMGYDFDTVPDWIIDQVLDLDLQRQAEGNRKQFAGGFDGFDNT